MTEKMLISSTIRNQIIRSTTRKIMVSTMKKSIKKPVIRKVACPETKGMFSIPEHIKNNMKMTSTINNLAEKSCNMMMGIMRKALDISSKMIILISTAYKRDIVNNISNKTMVKVTVANIKTIKNKNNSNIIMTLIGRFIIINQRMMKRMKLKIGEILVSRKVKRILLRSNKK